MKNRKAQIQMGENIAVLVIFFMLLGIGLILYISFSIGSAKDLGSSFFEKEAAGIALTIFSMSELKCPTLAIDEGNCIDILKVMAFQKRYDENISFRINYQPFFSGQSIVKGSMVVIREVFPRESEIILFNDTPERVISDGNGGEQTIRESKRQDTFFFPIVIRNQSIHRLYQNSFGVLEVTVFD